MSKPPQSNTLVWIRNSFRLRDNPLIHEAVNSQQPIIPVHILESDLYKEASQFGFPRMGPYRLKFQLESLADFKQSLRHMGSDLVFCKCHSSEQIDRLQELVEHYNVNLILTEDLPATYEKNDVALLRKRVKGKASVQEIQQNVLFHRSDLPFGENCESLPMLYTRFRKTVEGKGIRPRSETPRLPRFKSPLLPKTEIPSFGDLLTEMEQAFLNTQDKTIRKEVIVPVLKHVRMRYNQTDGESILDSQAAIDYRGGEKEALKRLLYYLFQSKKASTYKQTRNGLLGPDYSTKFSLWLSNGCLSPRTIFWELKNYEAKHGANDSTYWIIFELLWREYFFLTTVKEGARIFYKGGIMGKEVPEWPEYGNSVRNWCLGNTQDPFVDANMKELLLTGFQSNRGRQNVANFFCHQLNQDWRIGASYFEYILTDHDVQSNYLNWQYQSGVGQDGRPNRRFNTKKQANDYDPKGTYRQKWLSRGVPTKGTILDYMQ